MAIQPHRLPINLNVSDKGTGDEYLPFRIEGKQVILSAIVAYLYDITALIMS